MKIRYLTLSIAYLSFVLICGSAQKPAKPVAAYYFPKNTAKLQAILDSIELAPYQRAVFDCSNMTSKLYDALSAEGYQCEIMTGIKSLLSLVLKPDDGHAWLIAKKQGEVFWIQSTRKEIVPPSDFDDYYIRKKYASPAEAEWLFNIIGYENEWTY